MEPYQLVILTILALVIGASVSVYLGARKGRLYTPTGRVVWDDDLLEDSDVISLRGEGHQPPAHGRDLGPPPMAHEPAKLRALREGGHMGQKIKPDLEVRWELGKAHLYTRKDDTSLGVFTYLDQGEVDDLIETLQEARAQAWPEVHDVV